MSNFKVECRTVVWNGVLYYYNIVILLFKLVKDLNTSITDY